MTHLKRQIEFHRAFGQPVVTVPALPDNGLDDITARSAVMNVELAIKKADAELRKHRSRRCLRITMLLEEVRELLEAERQDNLVGIADALADIEVIADGTAIEYGIPLDAVRDEVHRANMSKLGADGKPMYREDGKVAKGPGYSPPNIEAVLFACADNPSGYTA